MSLLWWYLLAGLVVWILTAWWLVWRKLCSVETLLGAVAACLVPPEGLVIAALAVFFWPVCVIFVIASRRELEQLGAMEAGPTRSEELDEARRQRESLVNQSGVAATDLKPAGVVRIDGETYDAVCTGGFVPSGASVTVRGADDLRLEVQLMEEA